MGKNQRRATRQPVQLGHPRADPVPNAAWAAESRPRLPCLTGFGADGINQASGQGRLQRGEVKHTMLGDGGAASLADPLSIKADQTDLR